MAVRPADISFVFQGVVGTADVAPLRDAIAGLRKLARDAEVIVSTWHGTELPTDLGADQVVLSQDPGALHSIRPDGKTQNNVNRQIVSSAAGLAAATRRYAVKMRTDSSLDALGFLPLYETYAGAEPSGKIVVCSLFTLDPRLFEQVPFHISDWFHFGRTEALRSYWAAPLMSPAEAEHYGRHPHAAHSTHLDRRFYCLLAAEQHVAVNYARRLGYEVPRYHNDVRPEVLADHDRFLRERLIVAGPAQLGLVFAKYDWAVGSAFQNLNCISHLDWLGLLADAGQIRLSEEQEATLETRRLRKRRARRAYLVSRPLWPALTNPLVRTTVNWVLRRVFMR